MNRLLNTIATGTLVILSGVASAAIPGADGTISACFNKVTGQLRLIDAEAGQQCRTTELPVSWQQAATATLSCPEGTTLSTGVCIENEARAPATHSDAERDCAASRRRLPSGGELNTFRELPGITLASGFEWTDDVADTNASSTFHYFVVGDPGNARQEASTPTAYRCVAGPEVQ